MIYLDLINAVLTRLREEKITEVQFTSQSTPYIRMIAANVNDAKNRVEDSWQWGALRGTDNVPMPFGTGARYSLPNSSDNHYILKRVFATQLNVEAPEVPDGVLYPMTQVSVSKIRQRYLSPQTIKNGQPREFAVTGEDANGNIDITVYPPPEQDIPSAPTNLPRWGLVVDRINHQDELINANDRLKVPSLPVYTLATALSSRERGEVGGTPVSELFAIADSHLSDAIAQDSALYADELIWYGGITSANRTNIRTA